MTANNVAAVIGQTIQTVTVEDWGAVLTFAGGQTLRLHDDGHQCCERRYMHTDDTPGDYVGSVLLGIVVGERGEGADDPDGNCHDRQFLRVLTSIGPLVLCAHNVHNGYYAGFQITAEVE